MEHLFDKLAAYSTSGVYPCHMPGHKRNMLGRMPEALCKMDITEVEGFDNLHQPEGILKELQYRAATLCGAEESYYLVNGSTGGILSAVSAALPKGGRILMARNCHKSVYHAAYLRNLEISYLYPKLLEEYDIYEAVSEEQIRRALEKDADIGAVLIVSPTYEGRIADVAAIARTVHDKGIPLIVDEAHGAHLGLNDRVHENSCRAGADIVIQSTHKTLPALTQTALLHVNGALIDRDLLRRFLHIYQSSSPSYLLMASIDSALDYVEESGEYAFAEFERQYREMTESLRQCRNLRFLPADPERQDIGKLVISVKNTAINGKRLYDILLEQYQIQAEMAAENYVLTMFTLGDEPEGYAKVERALLEIDRSLTEEPEKYVHEESAGISLAEVCNGGKKPAAFTETGNLPAEARNRGKEPAARVEAGISLAAAWDGDKELIPLAECEGRYAGEFISLYPPGIPLAVPGEKITEGLRRNIVRWLEEGLTVQGIELLEEKTLVRVLKEGTSRKG